MLLSSFVGSRGLPSTVRPAPSMVMQMPLPDVAAFLPDFPSSMMTSAVANAWSVNGDTLNSADIASNLFAGSLFPYLAFLWFLARPESMTPKGVNFGFRFLLVFVFLTIPAGIYAKTAFHDILANVDWLHGGAESMLTLTNFFIIYGFRETRPRPAPNAEADAAGPLAALTSNGWLQVTLAASTVLAVASLALGGAGVGHPEPANALSVPTWMVHSSSLLEWLYAMKLVWEHAEVRQQGCVFYYYINNSFCLQLAKPLLTPNSPSIPHLQGVRQPAVEEPDVGHDSQPHVGHLRVHVPPLLQPRGVHVGGEPAGCPHVRGQRRVGRRCVPHLRLREGAGRRFE
jgi:hypothetical protein